MLACDPSGLMGQEWRMLRIGFDVGGTITDFTLLNEKNGELHFFKVPSTPADPSEHRAAASQPWHQSRGRTLLENGQHHSTRWRKHSPGDTGRRRVGQPGRAQPASSGGRSGGRQAHPGGSRARLR